MPTISTSDGVALNYIDEGEGTPVVLIAGFCAPLETWELQRRALLAEVFADPRTPERRTLLRDRAAQDWRDVIARITVPSLFLAGRESQLWPYRHAVEAAALNDLAGVVVLDDCGHAANLDQPEQANAAILKFLS